MRVTVAERLHPHWNHLGDVQHALSKLQGPLDHNRAVVANGEIEGRTAVEVGP
jgi:hypothetical protein